MTAMYRDIMLGRVRQQRILHDVALELTYACNLDCFYCYNDREKPGEPLNLGQYRQLLQELADMQTLFLMLTGGEPMIHPHFYEIGSMARELGFVTRVRTNGHNLRPRQAKRLRREVDPYQVEISLHGGSAASHDKQTRVPGSFQRLSENLATCLDEGLRLSLVCTPTAWNEHEIDRMFELSESWGVPLRFQGPVAPRDNGDTAPLVIQPQPETWRYIEQRHLASSNTRPQLLASDALPPGFDRPVEEAAMCGVGVSGVDIDPFGNVQACMHLQESAGNLHSQSITEIWQHAPLFARARERSVAAAQAFGDEGPRQYGAPVYCLAVEENANKAGCGSCGSACG